MREKKFIGEEIEKEQVKIVRKGMHKRTSTASSASSSGES